MGPLRRRLPKSKRDKGTYELFLDGHSEVVPIKDALDKAVEYAALQRRSHFPNLSTGLGLSSRHARVLIEWNKTLLSIQKSLGLDFVDEENERVYDQVVFTSSGAEAICQVHQGVYFNEIRETGKNHVIIPSSAPAPFHAALGLLEPLGVVVHEVKTTLQGIDLKDFEAKLSLRTSLVSLPLAEALTGTCEQVEEIAKLCRARHIALHIDISSMLGRSYVDFESIGADYITLSGNAIGAPFPSGLLLKKKEATLSPLISGDPSQGGIRAGGVFLPALKGFEVALDKTLNSFHEVTLELAHQKEEIKKALNKTQGITFFDGKGQNLPDVLSFGIDGIKGELLAHALSEEGIYVSIGGMEQLALSELLESKGIPPEHALTAVSMRLPLGLKEEEVALIVEKVLLIKERLSLLVCAQMGEL